MRDYQTVNLAREVAARVRRERPEVALNRFIQTLIERELDRTASERVRDTAAGSIRTDEGE